MSGESLVSLFHAELLSGLLCCI